MSAFIVGVFLILYGIMNLFHPDIPPWVLGLVALLGGALMLVQGVRPEIFQKKAP